MGQIVDLLIYKEKKEVINTPFHSLWQCSAMMGERKVYFDSMKSKATLVVNVATNCGLTDD
jgi:glutathione peroxidase-family protein